LPERALAEAANVFAPPAHRLTKVAEARGVAFWNDSKGTNFHAALGALDAVAGGLAAGGALHWIGGGQAKGGNIAGFAKKVAKRVSSAALIGETAPLLLPHFEQAGIPAKIFKKLPEAIRAAAAAAVPGDAVVFSPGFASFDMFKSYADRGFAFEQTVRGMKRGGRS